MKKSLILTLIFSTAMISAHAQNMTGERIRFYMTNSNFPVLTGTVSDQTGSSVIVQTADSVHIIDLNSVNSIQVSRGVRDYHDKGLTTGLFAGAITGMVVSSIVIKRPENNCERDCYLNFTELDRFFRTIKILSWGGAGSLVGAFIGARIGKSMKHEVWETTSTDFSVSLAPGITQNLKPYPQVGFKLSFGKR
jgi:hypothetical protein